MIPWGGVEILQRVDWQRGQGAGRCGVVECGRGERRTSLARFPGMQGWGTLGMTKAQDQALFKHKQFLQIMQKCGEPVRVGVAGSTTSAWSMMHDVVRGASGGDQPIRSPTLHRGEVARQRVIQVVVIHK